MTNTNKYLSIKMHGVEGEAQKISVFSCNTNPYEIDKTPNPNKPETGNEEADRLANNIRRARSAIVELVLNNIWDYFATLTVSPEKFDRKDFPTIEKALRVFLNHFKSRYAPDLKYLLVPEQHQDGSWHLHGFFAGIPDKYLEKFEIGMQMSSYLASKVKRGETIYNFPAYAKRFGFCDLEPIKDKQKCASYVTKYITKDLAATASALASGARLYYASTGLNRATRAVATNVSERSLNLLKTSARDGRVWSTDFGEGFDIDVPVGLSPAEYLTVLLDSMGLEIPFTILDK